MFRNNVPGSATRVPAGRSIPQCGVIALVFNDRRCSLPGSPGNESHWKQTRCVKRLKAFHRNLFCFHTKL